MNWITTLRRRFRVTRRLVKRPEFIAKDKPAIIGLCIDFHQADSKKEDDLKAKLAQAISDFGELPVLVSSQNHINNRMNVDLIRFAHRLDCPPHLFGNGPSLTVEQAEAHVMAGLLSYTCLVASKDDSVHQSVTGTKLQDTMDSVERLRSAGEKFSRPIRLLVRIPWHHLSVGESVETYEWLRTMMFDEISLMPQINGKEPVVAPDQLAYFMRNKDKVHKTSAKLMRYLSEAQYRNRYVLNKHLYPIRMSRDLFPFVADSILA